VCTGKPKRQNKTCACGSQETANQLQKVSGAELEEEIGGIVDVLSHKSGTADHLPAGSNPPAETSTSQRAIRFVVWAAATGTMTISLIP
jgi:hypothetical protein